MILETPKIVAGIVPAAPHQPFVNVTVALDPDNLKDQLGPLRDTYRNAGIATWSLWLQDMDGADLECLELEPYGYQQIVCLPSMSRSLVHPISTTREDNDLDYDVDGSDSMDDLGAVNDTVYGAGGELARALAVRPQGLPLHIYRAYHAGAAACVLATVDYEASRQRRCGVYFVATVPAARNRGLATRLLTVALRDARSRGCIVSTLQATRAGEPVYAALGYRTEFNFRVYTHVEPAGTRGGT
nr:GNAT family N-acetyltransferase [Streptomyces chartreusis]